MKRNYQLSTRILSLGIAIIVCFAILFGWFIVKVRSNLYEAKNVQTKHVVETAWGVVDTYAKQAKAGSLPLADAQTRAVAVLKLLRYNQNEYFWINDMEPRMVMHPMKPELDGQDISNQKDPNGKALFVAMVGVCKQEGAGFVAYDWPKPGSTKPVP